MADTDAIETQESKYKPFITTEVSSAAILSLRDLLQRAAPEPIYNQRKYNAVPFWYEILYADGWLEEVMRSFVYPWIEDENNIDRAAQAVNRLPDKKGKALYIGCCMLRFKAIGKKWKQTKADFRIPTPQDEEYVSRGERLKPQTLVFVALEDWSSDNGFFMELAAGSNVCIDSDDRLWLPATGGGAGICVALDI